MDILKDLELHNENVREMMAVWIRFHKGCRIAAERLGAVAYTGNPVGNDWVTFLMPDNSTLFGNIDVDGSFDLASEKWKEFFKVPTTEDKANFHKYHFLK